MSIKAFLFPLLAALLALAAGCGCGDDDDSSATVDDDAADDDADDDDTIGDDDSAQDDDAVDDDDAGDDDISPPCADGETRCDGAARMIEECDGGVFVATYDCLAGEGRYCEEGECVDRWRFNAPVIDDCAADPDATPATLAQKAAYYDDIAARLHIHPDHKRIHHVTLDEGADEQTATWQDVIDWHTGENDGLWTGLFIASQAFRYAATHDPDALAMLRVLVDGLRDGMEITGVPGLFTREFITPGIAGMSCPADVTRYIPDVEKDDNKWVKVDTDGAILVYDANEADFVRTTHFVPARFAGYCWLDNVSQDEYAGHLLALGSIVKLVDDPDVRADAVDMAEKVARHLLDNDMAFVDWDGRMTEHGREWPGALTDFPGYNTILGLNPVKIGAVASGAADLVDYYDNCLLQRDGPVKCIDQYFAPPLPFDFWLGLPGLYIGRDACKSNWNNFAMYFANIFTLIWYEHAHLDLLENMQALLETQVFYHGDNAREMANQHNAAWALIYASMKNLAPGSTGHDTAAIEDAVCQLQRFPESKAQPEIHVGEAEYPTDFTCESRFDGEYLTFDPVPVHQRCPKTFTWWSNPYEHQDCTANPRSIRHPADYLLPYWMARYFGWIGADR
ncbi:hypothetical protein K8I61_10830 [bacterium]|nr:hypothetical protein [bacterium]